MTQSSTRRDFLFTSSALLSGAWLSAHLPEIETLSAAARRAMEEQQNFRTLSAAEARTLTAFADQILPSGKLPGARDAGAIHFMDAALGGFAQPFRPMVAEAVKQLDNTAARRRRQAKSFADLSPAQQRRLMQEIQDEPVFGLLRSLTVMAVFSDPRYGGNRNQTAFRLLDVQHRPSYAPPFGYYDAQVQPGTKARQP